MLVIKEMRFDDLDEVCAIEVDSFIVPWTRQMFESELCSPEKSIYLVACEGKQLIGYIGLNQIQNEGHITTLAVHRTYRRRGIASELIKQVARAALQKKIDLLTLEVRTSNIAAQNLYRKLGFKVAGLRKHYYNETGEDALIMTATDIKKITG